MKLRYLFAPIVFIVILFLLRLVLFKGPVKPVQPLPEAPVIDIHVHAAGLGYGSDSFISAEMKNSFKFELYLRAFGVTAKELQQDGDQVVIQKIAALVKQSRFLDAAVILALDGVIDENGQLDKSKTQVFIPNDFIARETARYPSLYFGASINPYRPDALERLERVKRQGAVLIKWLPNIQHIDPADQRIIPFYKKLIKLNLPLLCHTGQERSFSHADDRLGDPQRLRLPLSLGVTVIAAHIATTGEIQRQENYQRIVGLFEEYKNLYADISSLTQVNKSGYLNTALVEDRLNGRLIYGSDFPLVNTALVSPWYFPLNLTLKQMWRISAIENPFDRDIALKQALGTAAGIFSRGSTVLHVQPVK